MLAGRHKRMDGRMDGQTTNHQTKRWQSQPTAYFGNFLPELGLEALPLLIQDFFCSCHIAAPFPFTQILHQSSVLPSCTLPHTHLPSQVTTKTLTSRVLKHSVAAIDGQVFSQRMANWLLLPRMGLWDRFLPKSCFTPRANFSGGSSSSSISVIISCTLISIAIFFTFLMSILFSWSKIQHGRCKKT